MGTPSYMAPEQAEGRKEIGPATDVYALGAILYEMLTGRPPFKAATAIDTIMQVVSEEPVPPTRLNAKAPADLETICLRCLQKDPRRRYLSAEALAEDLARWRRGEPIQARPVGKLERAWRWARRNPVVAGLAAAVWVVLLGGIGLSTTFAIRASRNEREARDQAERADDATRQANDRAEEARQSAEKEKKQREKVEVIRHGFQMTAASQACQQNEVAAAEAYLEGVAPAFQPTWEARFLRDLCRRKAMSIRGHADSIPSRWPAHRQRQRGPHPQGLGQRHRPAVPRAQGTHARRHLRRTQPRRQAHCLRQRRQDHSDVGRGYG
jgi:hypothetical protein